MRFGSSTTQERIVKRSKTVCDRLAEAIAIKETDPERAIEILLDLKSSSGKDPVVLGLLGTTLWRAGRPAEAVPILDETLTLNPSSLLAHGALFHSLWSLGRETEAMKALESAVELTGDDELGCLLEDLREG